MGNIFGLSVIFSGYVDKNSVISGNIINEYNISSWQVAVQGSLS